MEILCWPCATGSGSENAVDAIRRRPRSSIAPCIVVWSTTQGSDEMGATANALKEDSIVAGAWCAACARVCFAARAFAALSKKFHALVRAQVMAIPSERAPLPSPPTSKADLRPRRFPRRVTRLRKAAKLFNDDCPVSCAERSLLLLLFLLPGGPPAPRLPTSHLHTQDRCSRDKRCKACLGDIVSHEPNS